MDIFVVIIKEGISSCGDPSSILKTFAFMDYEVANRFLSKVQKIKEEFNEQKKQINNTESDAIQSFLKKYNKIPVNFHLLQSIELKNLGKLNVNLDCLEFKIEFI